MRVVGKGKITIEIETLDIVDATVPVINALHRLKELGVITRFTIRPEEQELGGET